MLLSALVAGTPHYVLMDGNRRIGPEVAALPSEIACMPIYGFSDKGLYDRFRTNGQQALKPYPLVKGYLRNQIDAPDDSLKLVVLDAADASEPYLHAATMAAVLEAHEKRSVHVCATHSLIFDQEANAYRLEETGE